MIDSCPRDLLWTNIFLEAKVVCFMWSSVILLLLLAITPQEVKDLFDKFYTSLKPCYVYHTFFCDNFYSGIVCFAKLFVCLFVYQDVFHFIGKIR